MPKQKKLTEPSRELWYMLNIYNDWSAMEKLVDAGLNESVVGSEFLSTAGIIAVVAVDNLKCFALYAVHVCFRH